MPRFSTASLTQLSTCHPELQKLFFEVIKTFDCKVLEGYRGEAKQNEAYAKGNSKLKWPNGKHNKMPSVAIDVVPYPIDWKNTNRFMLLAGFVMATALQLRLAGKMEHSIRWGGDWDRDYDITDEKGLIDLPHYEIIL